MRNIATNKQVFDRKSRPMIKIIVAYFFVFFAILTMFALPAVAQVVVTAPTPKPKPKATPNYPKTPKPPTSSVGGADVENPPPTPKALPQKKKKAINESEFPAEKSIEVDARVNIYLTVCEGNIKVNGWDRNEIRAFVKNGSEVGFKVTQRELSTGKPIILNVLGYDPQKNKQIGIESCLSGEEIELDVPHAAYVNIEAQEGDVNIYAIRKTQVKSLSGNIWLNDISQGTVAQTFGNGDVIVENSKGNLQLASTNGNVTVLNVAPIEVDDKLQTKTNGGAITMHSVQFSQVISNSNSGMIKLISNISSGGQYKLTTNGSIFLVIPLQTSCTINATSRNFQTDIPMKNITEDKYPNVKRIVGQLGTGDANLTLQTIGTISIKKSN
jgi:hypothetical protein